MSPVSVSAAAPAAASLSAPLPLSAELAQHLRAGLGDGRIIPCLGPGVLADVVSQRDGRALPVTSEAMIIAMNGGRPMAPKLMFEFSRAAMNIELKRGRAAIKRFLDTTYDSDEWTRAAAHDWLREIAPPYVIDFNRDRQLLDGYASRRPALHQVVLGCARLGGTAYRFRLFRYDGEGYVAIEPELADPSLPTLFKPLGAPLPGGVRGVGGGATVGGGAGVAGLGGAGAVGGVGGVGGVGALRPESSYIASDADFVDYLTELMGGFGVPAFLKRRREQKRYLLLGLRLTRDTERMLLRDICHGAAEGPAGWALLPQASAKERRFCAQLGFSVIDADVGDLMRAAGGVPAAPAG
ncbi:SIR2 family protein [Rhodocyclus gracilis]|uniref:SIR2 family protein n=1 Tax=Rhodocyclus tenuis TaxID=1066 RepID=A0A6L5JXX3_RHOTE|nr:SIR2 family protein [Rhodocyclus gracilis]MQY52175.1 SIR2 family protein [Rhodocyclus gracilis]